MQLKSMANPWPYRPDFTPTAALSVSHPTYLYQHCTWTIISIKFSTTTGRSVYIKHRLYSKDALTILKKKTKKQKTTELKYMKVHMGKITILVLECFNETLESILASRDCQLSMKKIKVSIPLFVLGYLFLTLSLVWIHMWMIRHSIILADWSHYNKVEGEKAKPIPLLSQTLCITTQVSTWPGHRCWQSNNLTKASQAED